MDTRSRPVPTPPGTRMPVAERRRRLERLPDGELCGRCAQGESLAWETLVHRYRRLVYAVPVRAGLRAEEAEEVFHSTFARLAERIATIKDRERVRAWIVTTARRLTIDVMRSRKGTIMVDEPDPVLERTPDPSPGAAEELEALERRHIVRQGLARLEDRCRRILRLLFYEVTDPPRSYESIAAELGMPLGSLGPTRARCLKKLSAELRLLERE